jgi:glutaredoxin
MLNKIKIIAVVLLIAAGNILATTQTAEAQDKTVTIFYSPTCPHCHHLMAFVKSTLKDQYPTVTFDFKNTNERKNIYTWQTYKQGAGLDLSNYGVPQTYIGDELIMGFGKPETTGKQIIEAIENKFFR